MVKAVLKNKKILLKKCHVEGAVSFFKFFFLKILRSSAAEQSSTTGNPVWQQLNDVSTCCLWM